MDTGVYVHGDLFLDHEEMYAKLLDMSWERKYSAGECIIEMGQRFSGFYLLTSGTIASSCTNLSGKKKTLGLHCARMLIGVSSLEDRPSGEEYICMTPVITAFIPKEKFEKWDNSMLLGLAQIQTHKSRNLAWQIEYAKYYSTEERTLRMVEEYERQLISNPNCGFAPDSGIKKQWVADILGITNVRLSHIISKLEKSGQILSTKTEMKLNPHREEAQHG